MSWETLEAIGKAVAFILALIVLYVLGGGQ
jgi:hypothetical protein